MNIAQNTYFHNFQQIYFHVSFRSSSIFVPVLFVSGFFVLFCLQYFFLLVFFLDIFF